METEILTLIFSTVPQFAFAAILFVLCVRSCNQHQEQMRELYEHSLLTIKEILNHFDVNGR